MNIEENYETGRPNEVFAILNHKIGQYKRNYKFVKIGITGQIPEERFEQHLKDYKWTKMVLIYKSSSINYCNQIEEWLVDYHYDDLVNQRKGGGSQLRLDGPNYVYVLVMGKIEIK
jgi:hypothetical protein